MILKFGKLKLYLPDNEPHIYYATFFAGEWDFLHVKEKDIVVDAGASVGDFTLKVAEKARKVIAIEPNPVYLDYLKKNVKENGLEDKVVIMPYAIYERSEKVKFKVGGTGSKVGEGEVEVIGMPFDEIIRIAGETNVDVIKMDIEGAESFVVNSEIFFKARDGTSWKGQR
ncbi:FkbM family methyltransferase [Acidianus sp. RZ1]|uniref:FkbM family methyltransferase n=1 Tax=Acidianus sp. RZ1 TaxID=1540082 RepID=UPI001490B980|nr:FkbM family methyltransferase [Acidianus sp. RZ1]NON61515.1 FkbM family methyltransferase [Acidianus sp. RZ1]